MTTTTCRLNADTSVNRAAILRNAWALAKANMSGTGEIRALSLSKRFAVMLRWEWAAAKQEHAAQHAWRPHHRAEIARIGREAAEQFCRAMLDYDRLSADRPSRDQVQLASRLRAVLNEPAPQAVIKAPAASRPHRRADRPAAVSATVPAL